MTYLIKSTNVYTVPTVGDALELRKELDAGPGELTNFSYTTKEIKAKGEVLDSFQLVKATLTFNAEKDPESTIREHYEEDI